MSYILSQDRVDLGNGRAAQRLLLNGKPVAIVGALRPEAAELIAGYFSCQWKWWAVIDGVMGCTWLVRSQLTADDTILVVDAKDQPQLRSGSWELSATARAPKIRTMRKRKASPK